MLDWFIIKYCERDKQRHLRPEKYKLTSSEENAGSAIDHDTLLHLETLLVVSAGNSEDVALELVAHDLAFDLLTHSSVVEGTAKKRVSGFAECTRRSRSRLRV